MNTRMSRVLAAAAMAVCAAGCATIRYSEPDALEGVTIKGALGKPGEHVFIETSGYYMFWIIPLLSGDVRWNDETKDIEGGFLPFRNFVSLAKVQNALTKLAESRDCDLAEVYFYDADTSYAGVSYVGAIGSCFGSSRMCASAVLVPRAAEICEASDVEEVEGAKEEDCDECHE